MSDRPFWEAIGSLKLTSTSVFAVDGRTLHLAERIDHERRTSQGQALRNGRLWLERLMTSVQDLEEQIGAYLQGRIELSSLEQWLASSAQDAAGADDVFRRLHNSAWLKVGEFDEGLLGEDELVRALTELLPSNQVLTWEGRRAPTVASAHRSIALAELRWQPLALTTNRWQLASTR